ncbi:MAG: hypothetical protein ABW146_08655 [Candidatus Sedimenticola sp. 6PFRAG7]
MSTYERFIDSEGHTSLIMVLGFLVSLFAMWGEGEWWAVIIGAILLTAPMALVILPFYLLAVLGIGILQVAFSFATLLFIILVEVLDAIWSAIGDPEAEPQNENR